MTQKKFFVIIIVVFLILIGIYIFLTISGAMFSFISEPSRPEITYGEFQFKITYKVNDETKVLEDIVVCEFDGFEKLGTAGKVRKWKSWLKSGRDKLVLFHNTDSDVEFLIYSSYGLPGYYMGDLMYMSNEDYEKMMSIDKELGYIEWKNGIQTGTTITAEEAREKYGIKIVNIQYDKPISNSF